MNDLPTQLLAEHVRSLLETDMARLKSFIIRRIRLGIIILLGFEVLLEFLHLLVVGYLLDVGLLLHLVEELLDELCLLAIDFDLGLTVSHIVYLLVVFQLGITVTMCL